MSREQHCDTIAAMYGTDTDTGRKLAAALIEELGTDALTDDALARLAAMHLREEEIQISESARRRQDMWR